MNDVSRQELSSTGVVKRELTGELVKEIKGQRKSNKYTLKCGMPWWQFIYHPDDLVRVGIEKQDDDNFPTVAAKFPNDEIKTGLIPKYASPRAKAILYKLYWEQNKPEDQQHPDWRKEYIWNPENGKEAVDTYGHAARSISGLLQNQGFSKKPFEESDAKIDEYIEKIMTKCGDGIGPLLAHLGFFDKY